MKIRVVAFAISIAAVTAIASLVSNSPAQPPAGAPPARQQQQPDEKPKNLKVLPKDMSRQQVVGIMGGYARALGVECAHCHAVKDGHPDFASDENPKKDIARGMMKMTDSINVQIGSFLASAHGGDDRVTVACATCHRGLTRPRSLAEDLGKKYEATGTDSALVRYKALRAQYYGTAAYDFGPLTLADVARRAQSKKDAKSAMTFLQFNVEQWPQSAVAHASLAEGYAAAGDTASAIKEYEQAVKLEPGNQRLVRGLDRLKRR